MSSGFVTWGLLIGIVGMIWVLVIATIGDMTDKKTPARSSSGSGDEPASGRLVRREAAEHPLVRTGKKTKMSRTEHGWLTLMVNAFPIFAGTHHSLSLPGKERKEEGGAP